MFFHNKLFKVALLQFLCNIANTHTHDVSTRSTKWREELNERETEMFRFYAETAQLLGFINNCIMFLLHNINACDHLHFSSNTLVCIYVFL